MKVCVMQNMETRNLNSSLQEQETVTEHKRSIYVISLRSVKSLDSREFRKRHFWLLSHFKKSTECGINFVVCSPNCPPVTGSNALK